MPICIQNLRGIFGEVFRFFYGYLVLVSCNGLLVMRVYPFRRVRVERAQIRFGQIQENAGSTQKKIFSYCDDAIYEFADKGVFGIDPACVFFRKFKGLAASIVKATPTNGTNHQ